MKGIIDDFEYWQDDGGDRIFYNHEEISFSKMIDMIKERYVEKNLIKEELDKISKILN